MTRKALARGYALLAVDSLDRTPQGRCFSFAADRSGVKQVGGRGHSSVRVCMLGGGMD